MSEFQPNQQKCHTIKPHTSIATIAIGVVRGTIPLTPENIGIIRQRLTDPKQATIAPEVENQERLRKLEAKR